MGYDAKYLEILFDFTIIDFFRKFRELTNMFIINAQITRPISNRKFQELGASLVIYKKNII